MKMKWSCSITVAPSFIYLNRSPYKNILIAIGGLHATPHTLRKLHTIPHTFTLTFYNFFYIFLSFGVEDYFIFIFFFGGGGGGVQQLLCFSS
jgi:hypothetical protein